MIAGEDIVAALEHATDLDAIQKALTREHAIRAVMAETGESREVVVIVADMSQSMAEESVLSLTEGEPTTLRDGLRSYANGLEGAAQQGSTLDPEMVAADLFTLLDYPWPND